MGVIFGASDLNNFVLSERGTTLEHCWFSGSSSFEFLEEADSSKFREIHKAYEAASLLLRGSSSQDLAQGFVGLLSSF